MERVKEEILFPIKQELKQESSLLIIDSGVKLEHIVTTVKKEENDINYGLVRVIKEESKQPFSFKSEANILTPIVRLCRLDVKDIQKINLVKVKTEEDGYQNKILPSVAELSDKVDPEEEIDDATFTENTDPEESEGDVEDVLQTTSKSVSRPQQSNSGLVKKKYVKERKFICKYCNKGFPQSDILERHIRTHTGERPYECSFCYKRFISQSILKRHSLNHTGKPFRCTFCGKRFLQSQGLKNHILIHEGKKPFKCVHCSMDFRQKVGMTRHIKRVHSCSQENKKKLKCVINLDGSYQSDNYMNTLHSSNKHTLSDTLKCTHCLKTFQNELHLSHHITTVHDKSQQDDLNSTVVKPTVSSNDLDHCEVEDKSCLNDKFECNDCGKSFTCKSYLLDHIQTTHSTSIYTCDSCGKTFKGRDNLIEHLKNIHPQDNKTRYCCRICGLAHTKKSLWKNHERLHANVFSYKCNQCDLSFKQKGGLKIHCMNVHQSEKPFRCVDCGSSFKMKGNLTAHIEVHHKNIQKIFPCKICKMEFKRECYLKRHVETHTGADRKFFCDVCGLGCRSKTDITKHVLTHIGAVEKSHVCDVCGARFSKKSKLVRHKRVHSDERTFKCELCEKAYKDPDSLKIHHETVHDGASFSCQKCGFKTINRQSFNRHLRNCL